MAQQMASYARQQANPLMMKVTNKYQIMTDNVVDNDDLKKELIT